MRHDESQEVEEFFQELRENEKRIINKQHYSPYFVACGVSYKKPSRGEKNGGGQLLWPYCQDKVIEFHKAKTMNEVASMLGVSRSLIKKVAKKLGLSFRTDKKTGLPANKLDGIPLQSLFAAGYNDTEIAEMCNASQAAVWSKRKKMNIPSKGCGIGLKKKYYSISSSYAKNSGWPVHLKRNQVAVLNILAGLGMPASSRQIASILSVAYSLPTIMSTLSSLKRGFLVSNVNSKWILSTTALSLLKERAKGEAR